MESNIHIGTLLKRYIKENNVSKAALARALGIGPPNLEVRLKQPSFRTDVLLRISSLLEHNFFADIAAMLPKELSTSTIGDKAKDDLIAELELEIKMLKRERDVLSNLISAKIK